MIWNNGRREEVGWREERKSKEEGKTRPGEDEKRQAERERERERAGKRGSVKVRNGLDGVRSPIGPSASINYRLSYTLARIRPSGTRPSPNPPFPRRRQRTLARASDKHLPVIRGC